MGVAEIVVMVVGAVLLLGVVVWVARMLIWLGDTPDRAKRSEAMQIDLDERLDRIEKRLEQIEQTLGREKRQVEG